MIGILQFLFVLFVCFCLFSGFVAFLDLLATFWLELLKHGHVL